MKKKILVVLLVIFTLSISLIGCAPSELNIDISSSNVGVDINQDMYGIFLEDISYAGDGGLVSNLVSNASFEYINMYEDNRVYTTEDNNFVNWEANDLECEVTKDFPLNSNNTNSLKVTLNNSIGYLTNLGYIEYYDYLTENYNKELMKKADMGFKKDHTYELSFYVKNKSYTGTLLAMLDSKTNLEYKEILLPAIESDWVKVTIDLKSNETEDGGLTLKFNGDGELYLDFFVLRDKASYGADTEEWKYVTLREDLVQALKDLNPGFVRFPGGCFAEGYDLDQLYNWKSTIGPLEARAHSTNIWCDDKNGKQYNNTNALGYHEYFQLCADLGASPVPILNAGMICQFAANYNAIVKKYNSGKITQEEWEDYLDTVALRPGTSEFDAYIQDILDLIEYANGDKDSTWGRVRVANGREEPFNLTTIGIGNENWGHLYFRNFDAIYKAIKEVYPEINIVSSAGYWFKSDKKDESWEIINEKYSDTIVDEHYYTSNSDLFDDNDYYDNYDRDGAKVFVGEYAVTCQLFGQYITKNNLWAAIEEASYLTGLERNGDIVKMASYAPTFAKINAQSWDVNMIWFDSQNIVLTPNYYNQLINSNNIGTKVINTNVKASGCYSVTTIDEDAQVIYVKLVNTNSQKIDLNLSFDGYNVRYANNMYLSNNSKAACNELNSTTVVPKTLDLVTTGSQVAAQVDGYSINVIRVCYGDNNGETLYKLPEMLDTMEQNIVEYDKFYLTLELVIVMSVLGGSILVAGASVLIWYLVGKKKKV